MGIESLTFFLLQLSDQTQLRKIVQILGARWQKHMCTATVDTLSVWKYYYSYISAIRQTWVKYYLLRADEGDST